MDNQGRVQVPEHFRSLSENPITERANVEIHYYYSTEEELFYFRIEEKGKVHSDEFLIGISQFDEKFRIRPLPEIKAKYEKNFILAMKESKIYFLPYERKED